MFIRYLRRFFKVRRANPQDDLASALIQAEEAGDKLSEDELLAMVFLLLIAGHETTVNLIAGGTLALLEHPDQMERLRQKPALIKPAVEELLRYTAPVFMSTERYAREDVTLHGVTIFHNIYKILPAFCLKSNLTGRRPSGTSLYPAPH